MINPAGSSLTAADFDSMAARWIDAETAAAQYLRRVGHLEAKDIIGANGRSGDFAGMLIPNVWPGQNYIREYRLRRDHPDIEGGKQRFKYCSPPGRGNLLYFPVGTDPAWLADRQLPLVITEGEFKTIALSRAARYGVPMPRFLAAGLSGVWNWRGTIGKTTDANGNRVDVKGPIPDLERITCDDRLTLILFDADIEENGQVGAARAHLTRYLRSRGAQVSWFPWPQDRPIQAKGIDDLLAAVGPEKVLPLIESALQSVEGEPDLIRFSFTDSGNADRLVTLHGGNLRYCFAFRKWLVWNGQRWTVDETGQVLKLAKLAMVKFLNQAVEKKNEGAEKFARSSLDARRLQAALTLAQPELPITPAELDVGPHLLNCLNGTVDLRNGELLPHRRADFLTKMVSFAYRPDATSPRWGQFLDEIMGAGPDAAQAACDRATELIAFLQPALGYSITGEVREKAVFAAHGMGDNGKTTLLAVVRDVIQEYSVTIGLDVLTAKDDSNNVAAARAKLLGARLAVSSETEEGQRLSAARLKRICQGPGGEIEACRKYENPITFAESHKLWIDANHKPELPATDAAVWNRLRLIPFTVTIPKEKQDRQLTAKLLAEREGILAWLVVGAKRWYEEGLPQSKIIATATQHWQEELDRLRAYIDERTERTNDPQAHVLNKALYESYKDWCGSNGEDFLPMPKFTNQMQAMGFTKVRKEQGNVWLNIRFKNQ
jgi:P4 family phage/plasmid primase-like protien